MTVKIDGILMQLEPPDLDKDGKIGGIEKVQMDIDKGITPIRETTETGEAIEHLSKDELNNDRLSSIEMISNLGKFEIAPMATIMILVAYGFLPKDASIIVRELLRLKISDGAKGRKDIVDIATARQNLSRELSIRQGMGNLTGGQK